MAHSKRTQTMAVLSWCERYGSITTKDAIDYLGITRLAAQINIIKHLPGHAVTSQWESVPTRYGNGRTRIKRYAITKTDNSCQGQN